jgi:hypothetical protein
MRNSETGWPVSFLKLVTWVKVKGQKRLGGIASFEPTQPLGCCSVVRHQAFSNRGDKTASPSMNRTIKNGLGGGK